MAFCFQGVKKEASGIKWVNSTEVYFLASRRVVNNNFNRLILFKKMIKRFLFGKCNSLFGEVSTKYWRSFLQKFIP